MEGRKEEMVGWGVQKEEKGSGKEVKRMEERKREWGSLQEGKERIQGYVRERREGTKTRGGEREMDRGGKKSENTEAGVGGNK